MLAPRAHTHTDTHTHMRAQRHEQLHIRWQFIHLWISHFLVWAFWCFFSPLPPPPPFWAAGSAGAGFITKQLPRGQETEMQPLLVWLLSNYGVKTGIKKSHMYTRLHVRLHRTSSRHRADEEGIFKVTEWSPYGVWCVDNDLGKATQHFLHIRAQ